MNCIDRVVTGLRPVRAERRSVLVRSPARLFLMAGIVARLVCLAPAQTSSSWRYDLRPGDHLTYRYTLQRKTQSDEDQTRTEARFQTHVLVVGANASSMTLGFQRNRESAELIEYRSKGKDRLAKERVDFQKRMQKRPSHFSEAMEVLPTGEPQFPWEIARETYSNLIHTFHEVMSLPPMPLAKGGSWRGDSLLGMDFRWVDDEVVHGKPCHHFEGALPDGSLKLTYWWSPE
jgi:hypothetical protein